MFLVLLSCIGWIIVGGLFTSTKENFRGVVTVESFCACAYLEPAKSGGFPPSNSGTCLVKRGSPAPVPINVGRFPFVCSSYRTSSLMVDVIPVYRSPKSEIDAKFRSSYRVRRFSREVVLLNVTVFDEANSRHICLTAVSVLLFWSLLLTGCSPNFCDWSDKSDAISVALVARRRSCRLFSTNLCRRDKSNVNYANRATEIVSLQSQV